MRNGDFGPLSFYFSNQWEVKMKKKISVKSEVIREDVKGSYYRVEVTCNFIDPKLEEEISHICYRARNGKGMAQKIGLFTTYIVDNLKEGQYHFMIVELKKLCKEDEIEYV